MNVKMLVADDKNTFGIYYDLELLPGRAYPWDDFGMVATDEKLRHG